MRLSVREARAWPRSEHACESNSTELTTPLRAATRRVSTGLRWRSISLSLGGRT